MSAMPATPIVEVVSATRLTEDAFWDTSALGQSLARMHHEGRIVTRITCENQTGLPELYNRAILSPEASDILLFVHDDVWLQDHFLVDTLDRGLRQFDVLGVAGNRRHTAGQVRWFPELTDTQALQCLSGQLGHGQRPFWGEMGWFGAVPAACELLDGVLLAARKATLRARQVQFDPQFRFHFYDLDFCRRARQQGLTLGTWPISITHQSLGDIETDTWRTQAEVYRQKWRPSAAA